MKHIPLYFFAIMLFFSGCGNAATRVLEDGSAAEVLSKEIYESLSSKYTEISDFSKGIAYIKDANGRIGLINNMGDILLDCVYESILDLTDSWGIGYAKLNGAWGVFNPEYKMITKCLYDSFRQPKDGLLTLSVGNRSLYGAIDITDGSTVIPFDYDRLGNYSEGLFAAELKDKDKNKAGYIDRNNQVVIPFIYADVEDFSEGLAAVHKYDRTVQTIFGPTPSKKCGFINKQGEVVIPFKFKWQFETIVFSEGLCAIGTANKSDQLYETNRNSFIDTKGNVVISGLFTDAEPFEHGVSRIKKNDKYGYINKKGEIIIPCTYDDWGYKDGCLVLKNNGIDYLFTYEGDLITE